MGERLRAGLHPVQHDLERAPPQLRVDAVGRLDDAGQRPEQHADVFVDQLGSHGAARLSPGQELLADRAQLGQRLARARPARPELPEASGVTRLELAGPGQEAARPSSGGAWSASRATATRSRQQLGDDALRRARPWWGNGGRPCRRRPRRGGRPRRCRPRLPMRRNLDRRGQDAFAVGGRVAPQRGSGWQLTAGGVTPGRSRRPARGAGAR